MTIKQQIKEKLDTAFSPSCIEITDNSHQHTGHVEAGQAMETHFHVKIVSDAFDGKSRPTRHRMVYHVLSEELAGDVHALAISAFTSDET